MLHFITVNSILLICMPPSGVARGQTGWSRCTNRGSNQEGAAIMGVIRGASGISRLLAAAKLQSALQAYSAVATFVRLSLMNRSMEPLIALTVERNVRVYYYTRVRFVRQSRLLIRVF